MNNVRVQINGLWSVIQDKVSYHEPFHDNAKNNRRIPMDFLKFKLCQFYVT